MRKLLLSVALTLFVCGIGFAGSNDKVSVNVNEGATRVVKATKGTMHSSANKYNVTGREVIESTVSTAPTAKANTGSGTQVGMTNYDLQTNNSICDRILVDPSGGVHVVWTHSQNGDIAAEDRGTGYNSMPDGGDFSPLPMVTERLEGPVTLTDNPRTGWPNIGLTASGRLFVISHFAGSTTNFGGLSWLYKDLGDPDWTHEAFPEVITTTSTPAEDTWPRVTVDGNVIHLVASRQRSEGAVSCNLEGGLVYYRSTDGGDTWEAPNDGCIPGLDPLNFPNIGGDSYAIDSHDGTVALICGGLQPTLFKSTNGGDDWTMEVIVPLENPLFSGALGETLPLTVTTDESYEVLVDNNGLVHVWYGRNVIQDDDDAVEGWSFFPTNNALMYWNEDMDSAPVAIGNTVRQDQDGDMIATYDTDVSEAQTYFQHIVSMPSAGIDADNNFYVTYSGTVEGDNDANNTQLRSLFIIKSMDGGATWVGPSLVSDAAGEEAVYGSMARTVTNEVHVVYQSDDMSGTAVQADDLGYTHPIRDNGIQYVTVNVDDIVDPDPINNTAPDLLVFSAPFGFQNCAYDVDGIVYIALDYPDGEISVDVSGDLIDNLDTPGTGYTLIVTATDSDGNTTDPAAGTFDASMQVFGEGEFPMIGDPAQPIPDGIPLIILYPDVPVEVTSVDVLVGSTFDFDEDEDVLVIDDGAVFGCDPTVTVNNPVDINTPGTYEVTVDVVDINGNQASQTLTVNVIAEDLTPPTIELVGEQSSTIDAVAGSVWIDPGYFAFDNLDGDITDNVTVTGDVNAEVPGTYEVTYSVTDNAGLTTEIVRTIIVVDSTAPTIFFVGAPANLTLCCNGVFNPFDPTGYNVTDNVDASGTLVANLTITLTSPAEYVEYGNYCATDPGQYVFEYSVEDAAGNVATRTRTITIASNTPPNCPETCNEPCVVGIEDNALNSSIGLFPNPTNGLVNLNINDVQGKWNVTVYNVLGEVVENIYQSSERSIKIDLSDASTGVYFVNVSTEVGSITKKVVLK